MIFESHHKLYILYASFSRLFNLWHLSRSPEERYPSSKMIICCACYILYMHFPFWKNGIRRRILIEKCIVSMQEFAGILSLNNTFTTIKVQCTSRMLKLGNKQMMSNWSDTKFSVCLKANWMYCNSSWNIKNRPLAQSSGDVCAH